MERHTNDYEHIRPKLHRNLLTMIDRGLLVYNRATHTWYVWGGQIGWQTNGDTKAISESDINITYSSTDTYKLKELPRVFLMGVLPTAISLDLNLGSVVNLNINTYKEYQFESLLKTAIRQILCKVEIDKLNLFEIVDIGDDKIFRLMSTEDKQLVRSLGTLLCLEESEESEAEDDFMDETQPIGNPATGGEMEGIEFGGFLANKTIPSVEEKESKLKEVMEGFIEVNENPSPIENKKSELTCSEISKTVNEWNNAYSWSNYGTNGYHYVPTPSRVSIPLNTPSPTTTPYPFTQWNSEMFNGYLSPKEIVGTTIHNTKGDRYTFVSIGDERVLEFLIYVGLVNEVKLFQGSEKIYATLKSNVMIGLTVLESAGVSEVNLADRTITFTYDSTGNDSYSQAVYGFDEFMDRVLKGDIYVRNFDMSEGRKLYIVKFC